MSEVLPAFERKLAPLNSGNIQTENRTGIEEMRLGVDENESPLRDPEGGA